MNQNYSLYFDFIDTFSPSGFVGIDRNHPLLQELEQMMKVNNQFFGVLDAIQMKILFASKRSNQMIGVSTGRYYTLPFF